MRTRPGPRLALAIAGALLLAACGGDDDSSDTTTAGESPAETLDATTATTASEQTDEEMTSDDTTAGGSGDVATGGDWEPGNIEFRAVNLLDEPVDLYVRTTGVVEAFLVQEGLAPGEVSELYAPPTDGVFLVTEAGATDPTCVVDCDQFIAELGTAFREDEGPVRTAVLYEDADFSDGEPRAYEIWEDPDPSLDVGSNAMPAADPDRGIFVVSAFALTDDDFGSLLAYDGVGGCQEYITGGEGLLVGGTSTLGFAFDESVDVLLYDNRDQECAETATGGPFSIEGAPGSRTHLILFGSPGNMEALILPFVGSDSGEGTPGSGSSGGSTDDDTGDDADPGGATGIDDLVTAFAVELEANLGIAADDAQCVSEAFVGGLGEDELRDESGGLRDLDDLPLELQDLFEEVLLESITLCDIDPSTVGG